MIFISILDCTFYSDSELTSIDNKSRIKLKSIVS